MKKSKIPIILSAMLLFESACFVYFVVKANNEVKELNDYVEYYSIQDQIATNGKIYMIGNSLISNGSWNELLNNQDVVNKGISGITTMDAVMMADQLMPGRADEVFIMLGVNDIKVSAPWDVAYVNYNSILYSIKHFSPKTQINIISVLPVNFSEFLQYDINNSEIGNLNIALAELCIKYDFNYIDCHSDFSDANGELLKSLSTDGLHLNEAGYEKLASWIIPHI